jgi:hypothetical protein
MVVSSQKLPLSLWIIARAGPSARVRAQLSARHCGQVGFTWLLKSVA